MPFNTIDNGHQVGQYLSWGFIGKTRQGRVDKLGFFPVYFKDEEGIGIYGAWYSLVWI